MPRTDSRLAPNRHSPAAAKSMPAPSSNLRDLLLEACYGLTAAATAALISAREEGVIESVSNGTDQWAQVDALAQGAVLDTDNDKLLSKHLKAAIKQEWLHHSHIASLHPNFSSYPLLCVQLTSSLPALEDDVKVYASVKDLEVKLRVVGWEAIEMDMAAGEKTCSESSYMKSRVDFASSRHSHHRQARLVRVIRHLYESALEWRIKIKEKNTVVHYQSGHSHGDNDDDDYDCVNLEAWVQFHHSVCGYLMSDNKVNNNDSNGNDQEAKSVYLTLSNLTHHVPIRAAVTWALSHLSPLADAVLVHRMIGVRWHEDRSRWWVSEALLGEEECGNAAVPLDVLALGDFGKAWCLSFYDDLNSDRSGTWSSNDIVIGGDILTNLAKRHLAHQNSASASHPFLDHLKEIGGSNVSAALVLRCLDVNRDGKVSPQDWVDIVSMLTVLNGSLVLESLVSIWWSKAMVRRWLHDNRLGNAVSRSSPPVSDVAALHEGPNNIALMLSATTLSRSSTQPVATRPSPVVKTVDAGPRVREKSLEYEACCRLLDYLHVSDGDRKALTVMMAKMGPVFGTCPRKTASLPKAKTPESSPRNGLSSSSPLSPSYSQVALSIYQSYTKGGALLGGRKDVLMTSVRLKRFVTDYGIVGQVKRGGDEVSAKSGFHSGPRSLRLHSNAVSQTEIDLAFAAETRSGKGLSFSMFFPRFLATLAGLLYSDAEDPAVALILFMNEIIIPQHSAVAIDNDSSSVEGQHLLSYETNGGPASLVWCPQAKQLMAEWRAALLFIFHHYVGHASDTISVGHASDIISVGTMNGKDGVAATSNRDKRLSLSSFISMASHFNISPSLLTRRAVIDAFMSVSSNPHSASPSAPVSFSQWVDILYLIAVTKFRSQRVVTATPSSAASHTRSPGGPNIDDDDGVSSSSFGPSQSPQASSQSPATTVNPSNDRNSVSFLNAFQVLMDAIQRGDISAVRTLLCDGSSPYHASSSLHHPLPLTLSSACTALITHKNDAGWSPLHVAVRWGHLQITRLLISLGAPLNAMTAVGATPLHLASAFGHIAIAALLVHHDGGGGLLVKNDDGQTPIDIADALAPIASMKEPTGSRPSRASTAPAAPSAAEQGDVGSVLGRYRNRRQHLAIFSRVYVGSVSAKGVAGEILRIAIGIHDESRNECVEDGWDGVATGLAHLFSVCIAPFSETSSPDSADAWWQSSISPVSTDDVPSPASLCLDYRVNDNGDGTYTIVAIPEVATTYRVVIRVGSLTIPEPSPRVISILPAVPDVTALSVKSSFSYAIVQAGTYLTLSIAVKDRFSNVVSGRAATTWSSLILGAIVSLPERIPVSHMGTMAIHRSDHTLGIGRFDSNTGDCKVLMRMPTRVGSYEMQLMLSDASGVTTTVIWTSPALKVTPGPAYAPLCVINSPHIQEAEDGHISRIRSNIVYSLTLSVTDEFLNPTCVGHDGASVSVSAEALCLPGGGRLSPNKSQRSIVIPTNITYDDKASVFVISFVCQNVAGRLSVDVCVDGRAAGNSPFQALILSNPIHPTCCSLHRDCDDDDDDALSCDDACPPDSTCVVDTYCSFLIVSRDSASLRIPVGGGKFEAEVIGAGLSEVSVVDLGDGSYRCRYSVPSCGPYTVCVTNGGRHVKGSPFKVVAIAAIKD